MIRRIVAAIVHHQNYFIKIEHLQQAHFLLLIWLSTFTLLFWIISIPSVKCSMLNSGNVRQQPNIQPDFHSMTLLHYDDNVDDEQMDESYLSGMYHIPIHFSSFYSLHSIVITIPFFIYFWFRFRFSFFYSFWLLKNEKERKYTNNNRK